MRTIRAVVVTALTWGIAWALIGSMVGLVAVLIEVPFDTISWGVVFGFAVAPVGVLCPAGILSGAVFAATLGRMERGRTLDTLSISRAAIWGALGGLAFSAAGLALVAALFGVSEVIHFMVPVWIAVATSCGAISAAGSLAIARKGTPGLLEEAAEMQRLGGG